MTKEQFLNKWHFTGHCLISKDLDAVIAHEIANVQEKPKPALNPIAEAYERGENINKKTWEKGLWIKKHSNNESMQEDGRVVFSSYFNFNEYPELWELYTEPTEQPKPKQKITPTDDDIKNGLQKLGDIIATPNPTEQPAKPFDRERFEAMFRAVVASGRTESYEQDFFATNIRLEKLDAYYAEKEKGGNNE